MTGRGWLVGGLGLALLVTGCATKGAVRRVETEMVVLQTMLRRQDSARAAELTRVIDLQQRTLDSLAATRDAIRQVRSDMGGELLAVQQSLVQIQELTGQSQRRLGELRRQLDDRAEDFARADSQATPILLPDTTAARPPAAASPDQLFQVSLQELRRQSTGTARAGFHEFLRTYPTHTLVPSALYWVGETFGVDRPDSAAVYYEQVVARFPTSPHAPTSLYKLGLLAEQRGDRAGARAAYQRVIDRYPRADEADLARQRLATLQP